MGSQARRESGTLGLARDSLTQELVADPPGQAIGSRRLLQEHRKQVVAGERSGPAEDGLGAAVVVVGRAAEFAVDDGPARRRWAASFKSRSE